jgi:D-arabinose 1-dehydrogenase-like Zn-dependent alcohol dehydrogenase
MALKAQGVIARGLHQMQVEEMIVDLPGPGEVLVRLLSSGVCHTDLHVLHGIWR